MSVASDGSSAEPSVEPPRASPRLRASAALALAWVLLPALAGGWLLLRLGAVGDWLRGLGEGAIAVYALLFALTSGLGLLPTYASAVLGGWVFGLQWGIGGALAGFLGGAMIGWLIARGVGGDAIRERIDRHPRASIMRRAFVERGFLRTLGVVALLRLPPNSPFALTNLAMAGSGVRPGPFALGTLLGMAPRTAVMVGIGAAGAASGAKDIQSLAAERGPWFMVVGIATILIVLMILGHIGNLAVRRVEASESSPSGPPPAA